MKKIYARNYITENRKKHTVIFIVFLLSFLIVPNIIYSQEEQCDAKLLVENNDNNKTANQIGVSYKLSLTNFSNESTTFDISIINDNSKLISNDKFNFKNELYAIDKKEFVTYEGSNYSITLNANETFNFFVKLREPSHTKTRSKNITEVIITSKNCKDFSVSTLLHSEMVKKVINNI